MRPYRTLFFLLICNVLCLSCSQTGRLRSVQSGTWYSTPGFNALDGSTTSLLFKARISLFRDAYPGLFLIKEIPADSSTRIVFLSEIGLSLMDLEYHNDEFKVVSVKDFLDRPSVMRVLKDDFRTLLLDLDSLDPSELSLYREGDTQILRFRHKSRKYSYFHTDGQGLYKIERRSGLFSKTIVTLNREDALHIGIKSRGLKPDMDLQQIEKKYDHAN